MNAPLRSLFGYFLRLKTSIAATPTTAPTAIATISITLLSFSSTGAPLSASDGTVVIVVPVVVATLSVSDSEGGVVVSRPPIGAVVASAVLVGSRLTVVLLGNGGSVCNGFRPPFPPLDAVELPVL